MHHLISHRVLGIASAFVLVISGGFSTAAEETPATPDAPPAQETPAAPEAEPMPEAVLPPQLPTDPVSLAPETPAAAPDLSPKTGGPNIVSPEPVFDFGTRDNDGQVQHEFVIRNTGDAPLKIDNVKSSCGCTVAELKKKDLAPGEETTVGATFNLRGRSGQQKKTITVQSNDPDQPMYSLELVGEAKTPIEVSPAALSLGAIEGDTPTSGSVTISAAQEGLTFNIKSVDTFNEFLKASFETLEEGRQYRVNVVTAGSPPDGPLNANVRVETDNPNRPIITFFVNAQVLGPVEVRPPRLNLVSTPDADRNYTLQVDVRPGTVKEFNITRVVLPIQGMNAEVLPLNEGGFRVRLLNVPANDKLAGKAVKLETDNDAIGTVEVPFNIIQRNPVPQAGIVQPRPAAASPASN
jgi:hypothetical protein